MPGQETKIFDHEIRLVKIETTLKDVKGDTDEILKCLKGDNGDGHSTRIALVEQSNKRLWWFVPIGLTIATTVISYFL